MPKSTLVQRMMCKSKVWGLTVTHKSLKCSGSIEIPENILKASDILSGEMVLVVNETTGARFETYAIKSEKGKCGLLGGAARLGEIGDKIIVLSYVLMENEAARQNRIKVIKIGDKNSLV